MGESAHWLTNWHAAHQDGLRARGIGAVVNRPHRGTPTRGRPKATAVSLTLESGERLGHVFVWESGSASLLFIDSRSEYMWQDEQELSSEGDLPRVLAPLIELVEGLPGSASRG